MPKLFFNKPFVLTHDYDIMLLPEEAFSDEIIRQRLARESGLSASDIKHYEVIRRSIDARRCPVKYRLRIRISDTEEALNPMHSFDFPNVKNAEEVLIIGFGPAGMFAAMELIMLGYKPIVLERGADVQERRRDLKAINRDHVVNPESNYCFGEGGAGTYSDGKLYTRSHKRGNIIRILDNLVFHGAPEDIRVDAHPHIGTNKLPKVVQNIRKSILDAGGEIHFNTRADDFLIENNQFKGVQTADGSIFRARALILASGHSARDIFELLHKKQIEIENKPFALGVRIEHPQDVIDRFQYHCDSRGEYLPPASYALVEQVKGRGVYSFCMCPGGFIVPAATAPGEIVVNGMSPSRRDGKFANSGMVVSVEPADWQAFSAKGPLAAMHLQASVEQKASQMAGGTQAAPAQRMLDFYHKKNSPTLNDSSYIPGLVSVDMHELLPDWIGSRLREAFKAFGKKMPAYYTNEANIVGVESRTSSPVRIPRDNQSLQHPQIEGLYPCGEGAGYAGGIVSAAMDGERVARALAQALG